jgi:Flp pilus assembly protein TadD
MADTGRIEELKAEGNSLHSQKKYREAYNKFTEAIELAPDNAILHCNRAAASMTMNE